MSQTARGTIVAPIALISGLALVLVGGAVAIDGGLSLIADPGLWLAGLQGEGALDRVANAAEVIAGVLAIAITVAAIVVELAANRYTSRITQLFVRNTTNRVVLSLFVLTTIVCLWTSAAPLEMLEAARVTSALAMAMATLCLLALLPYFMFLFRFLEPRNIIARIGEQALEAARNGQRPGMLEAIEELEDLARVAHENHDRSIALASVDALADVLRGYLPLREELPASWFKIDLELARDPDFVALAPSTVRQLEEQRIWLEAKIFRQFLSLFEAALGEDRDLGNLVALDTRSIATEHAAENADLLDLAIRFFNSYLRVAIRTGDIRAAYYVFDQYRAVAEDALQRGDRERLRRIATHLHEYGDLACDLGHDFLLEVIAWDIATLIEQAATSLTDEVDQLLDRFVSVDRKDERREQEERQGGVRRIQIQLATLFLLQNDEARALRIAEDMRSENPEQLAAIRKALEDESREQYWEFTDRGVNFSYLPPDRRAQLPRFFDLLAAL
ncbi:MAG: DUF2254 family protein [Myxococcota bacterium]|nr:DUF2254 family protein [Myxococcota bacterium]